MVNSISDILYFKEVVIMNNNNNNVSGMVNDTLLVVVFKSLVRDVVREELLFQGIPVNNEPHVFGQQQTFGNMQMPNMNYDTRTGGILNKPNNTQFDFKINRPWYENRIDNDYSSNEFCNNIIADAKAKKYEAFKNLGFFDLMPNGFSLYLDDEDIVEDDDSKQALLDYDFNDDCYTLISNSAIKITRDDLLKCTITYIGSDICDLIPAVWIKPDEDWYAKRDQYSRLTSALINVTNKKYAIEKNAIEKALMKADATDNAKPKRRRKSTK
jgi:hypothetical protein